MMKKYNQYKQELFSELFNDVKNITQENLDSFTSICKEYISSIFNEKTNLISEAIEHTRYSVEVNYRTKKEDVLGGFAKIALGYVSAALKRENYHVKLIFDEEPYRIIVSARNWDDGGWCGLISYNHKIDMFVLSKGFYNKSKKTVSVTHTEKIDGEINASSMTKKLKNVMDDLKNKKDMHKEKLKGINLKRGPKS